MKALIPHLALVFLVFTILSIQKKDNFQQEPTSECIKSTNRNLVKASYNLDRIEAYQQADSSKIKLKKEAIRFNTVLDGLESSIMSCKRTLPEYDFTEIDMKAKAIREKYEAFLKIINSDTSE